MPKDRLEKLRTKVFHELIDQLAWNPMDRFTGLKPKKQTLGYREFLKGVDELSRQAMEQSNQNLQDAINDSSIYHLIQIVDAPTTVFMKRLVDMDIKGFDSLSAFVLDKASKLYVKKYKKSPLDAARPVAKKTYEAILMDMWPDSPAAIADFWLTDQKHYEALYYPIRASEITVEDLDQVLGDPEAITKLVNTMPSNPHKSIVFGFEPTQN